MSQIYRTAIIVLAISNAGAIAQTAPLPKPPVSAEAIMALPVCPDSIPLGADIKTISVPADGGEHTASVGDTVIVGNPVAVRVQALRFEKAFSYNGAFKGRRFVIGVPAGVLRFVDEYSSLQGAAPLAYRLANGTIRFFDENGQPGKVEVPKLWFTILDHGNTLHTEVKLSGTMVRIDLNDAPISTELCRDKPYQPLQREILYGGVAGRTITLQYREFVNGIARPAFSQEATFDLSAGNELAFKSVHLTVLEASNTGLRYIVRQPFGD